MFYWTRVNVILDTLQPCAFKQAPEAGRCATGDRETVETWDTGDTFFYICLCLRFVFVIRRCHAKKEDSAALLVLLTE